VELVDSHTHLYLPEFDRDRDHVMQQALEQGIKKMFLPNIDLASVAPMLQLCDSFPDHCYPMLGLHPGSVRPSFHNELEEIFSLYQPGRYCAIGEVGIDLYWDKTFAREQAEAFSFQVRKAQDYNLPLVIHIRNSFDEVFAVLKKEKKKDLYGIFHSFTGNKEQALRAIGLGFLLGINGILTYKNSGLQEVVKHVSLEHLVLETDAPYLPPVPHRGERNESRFLVHTAARLAELKQCSLDEVAEITSHNAMNLFTISHSL
jgi:TatD DNase family protein